MTFIPGSEDEENDERKGGRRLSRGANSAQPPNSSFGTCTSWSGKGRTTVTLRVQVPFFKLTEGKKGRPNYSLGREEKVLAQQRRKWTGRARVGEGISKSSAELRRADRPKDKFPRFAASRDSSGGNGSSPQKTF